MNKIKIGLITAVSAMGATTIIVPTAIAVVDNNGMQQAQLFDIKDNKLAGFNPSLTSSQIEQKISNHTLVIPEHITEIGLNAFYRDGKSTIPSSITKLEFADNSCKYIHAHAFQSASFEEIVFPSWSGYSVIFSAHAFGSLHNLKVIDAAALKHRPDERSVETVFDDLPTSHGVIKLLEGQQKLTRNTTAANWFVESGFHESLLIGSWSFAIGALAPLYDISKDGKTLTGFNIDLDSDEIAEKIHDHELIIPRGIEHISYAAFRGKEDTLIPKNVETLIFLDNSCNYIGANAFRGASFKTIILPAWKPNSMTFGAYAFADLKNLTSIDASALTGNLRDPESRLLDNVFLNIQDTTPGQIQVAHQQGSITDTTKTGYWFYNSGFKNVIDNKKWSIVETPSK